MSNEASNNLYRYRTVSEHSINELLNDELVLSTLDTFNDPCDATLGFFDIDYHKELICLKAVSESLPKEIGAEYFADENVIRSLKIYYDDHFRYS